MAHGPETSRNNGQFHFNPETYLQTIKREVPDYEELQDAIARSANLIKINRFLDLGAGTGETAARILTMFPHAEAVLVEQLETMISVLRNRFKSNDLTLSQSNFGEGIPDGSYCAVVSAFAVHHLQGEDKKTLFKRIYSSLKAGGVFAFGDVYVPESQAERKTPIDPKHDFPSPVGDVQRWLTEVGFSVATVWQKNDLTVFACQR